MTDPVRTRRAWLLPMATLALIAGILLGRSASSWQGPAVGLAAGLLYTILTKGRKRTIGTMLVVLFFGSLISWHAYNPPVPAEGTCLVSGVVTQEVELRENMQVRTRLSEVTIDGQPWSRHAYWSFYLREDETLPQELTPGARVTMEAQVYHLSGADNPEGYSFREAQLQSGVTFGVYGADGLTFPQGGFSLPGMTARIRHLLTRRLLTVMGSEAGAYAAAMLLGERAFLPEEDLVAFRHLGISHILSVSGFHVGVLSAMLALMMKPLRQSPKTQLLLRTALLAAYCMLTGGHAPVIRATLLTLLWETARIRHRQALPLHGLCCAAALQLLFNPTLLTGASFQLTYGAMLGLLLIRPRLDRLVPQGHSRMRRFWRALSASIAVQLGILPAQLYWFGSLPLLSLVCNLFVLTLTTGLMALYWLTLGLLWLPGVNAALGWLSAQATGLLLAGVRLLGSSDAFTLWVRRPGAVFLLGWLLLVLGLIAMPPKRFRRLQRRLVLIGTALALFILVPLPHRETTYIQFSVGEADAALLHDMDRVIVIDTGEDGQALAGYLHARRLTVDTLILTHLHTDHAGGVQALLDKGVPVRECCLPADAFVPAIDPGLTELLQQLAADGTTFRFLGRGDVIETPSGTLTALWPVPGRTRPLQDANHASLTLLASLRGTTMLLTGDLTTLYEGYAAHPADVLKAAHHGSDSSTSAGFIDAVSPQLILLSCGNEKRVTSLVGRSGDTPLYSTEISGAITLRFDEGSFRVYPCLAD